MHDVRTYEGGWPSADLESVSGCPACNGAALRPYYSGLVDHEEGVPGRWAMAACLYCGSLVLDPRPTLEALPRAYGSYYTHFPPDVENAVLWASGPAASIARAYLRRRYGLQAGASMTGSILVRLAWPLRQQLDYFMRHLPARAGSVLDIGCGSGGFLARAALAGWDGVGVEPDGPAAAVARANSGTIVYPSLDNVAGQEFDVITMAHVIEHLHEPRETLQRCRDLLRPGGQLWIATPNIRGPGHRLYREAWQPLETPRHIVMPTASALAGMLTAGGFDTVRFVRRGRGSVKRLQASAGRARSLGRRSFPTGFLALCVDIAASIWSRAAEELVVTARKPCA